MAQFYSLDEAARVLGMSPEELKTKAQHREVRAVSQCQHADICAPLISRAINCPCQPEEASQSMRCSVPRTNPRSRSTAGASAATPMSSG